MTQVFLTAGSSFPDPGNWNPNNNKVECLGYGGKGGNSGTGNLGAGGGGGGDYAVATNMTPTWPAQYCVGTANSGICTNFNTASTTASTTPGTVSAGFGVGGSPGIAP
jgi:hypothetical protein